MRHVLLSILALPLVTSATALAQPYGPPSSAPPPPPGHVAHRAPSPAKWELGLAIGHIVFEDQVDGDDGSLLLRYRLTSSLRIEGELGAIEFDAGGSAGRMGGALLVDVGGGRRFQPYLSVGVGSLADDFAEETYGEIGGGIELPLARSFALVGDVRAGALFGDNDDEYAGERLRYARWRVMGVLRF